MRMSVAGFPLSFSVLSYKGIVPAEHRGAGVGLVVA